MRPVRVLIVDDQVLMRQGLRKLLEIEPAVEVVGDAAGAAAALALLERVETDVALVDVRMPHMDGIALIEAMSHRHPAVAAVILTTFDDDDYVFGGLRAGARGYLLKDTPPEELVSVLCRAARGETVLGGAAAARLVAGLRSDGAVGDGGGLSELSPREHEVARLVGDGATNREIARRLYITEGTVKNHISAVLRKLGLRDRTRLALYVAGHRPD
ncbi:two component transcriptional regulator, LuxR family [Stackebrandtia albiflava]|uniref:Two component transcriptional regulator, LuxR family n=1 Tax=Stackebrandtia albiflava TaxID=406432 RepID=A0A562UQP6_9ACTN|nr:response regulator transcription factor [Stackebrandtia albiflava]TWJ07939.1 two component transcriptional regulator, LuxR family [Stackebrandtia albiflava]